MNECIGRVYAEVRDLDWSGWYPIVSVVRDEIIVDDIIEADADDVSGLVCVDIDEHDGGEMIVAAQVGWQDAFMREDEYRAIFDAQTGGAA